MKMTLKAVLGMALALLLAAAGGWVWGAAGRWSAEDALRQSGVRLHRAHAQANLYKARVNLFEQNYGDAGQSLAAARADILTVAQSLDAAGETAGAARLREAVERIAEAIDAAARLDQAAGAKAADALRLLLATP